MEFLSSCGYVHSTVCRYHIDANKMLREKGRYVLDKKATSYLEQILEATTHEQ